MLFSLALRNVKRNLRRLAPMMFSLVLVFALLIMGNAVLNTTLDALYGVYARNVTGDLTVSPKGEENFTVFGSDQLLVGQYLVPPALVGFAKLQSSAEAMPQVRSSAGLVSSAARVELAGRKQDSTVFGVNFGAYPAVVPGLQLEAGKFPAPGQPGIVVQARGWKNAAELIGRKVLLAAGLGRSFTLREVPLTGVFSYPVQDEMLGSVVLVNASTARALNGYLYSDAEEIEYSDEERDALESDFDTLFGGEEEGAAGSAEEGSAAGAGPAGGGIDPQALFSDSGQEPEQESGAV